MGARRAGWLLLPLLVVAPIIGLIASTAQAQEVVQTPGPVQPGYRGSAYLVPRTTDPGSPNTTTANLEDGPETQGTVTLRSGQPYDVAVDAAGDVATVSLDDGRTATAAASEFWVMPSFIDLRYLMVEVGPKTRPLGLSGVRYYRETESTFDDPATPEFDGIPGFVRGTLACKRQEWSIGQQTFTVDLIEQGVHRNDRGLIDKGIVGLRWGTSLGLNDDAAFELTRDCGGGVEVIPDHGGTHHTTQFVEAMGRAVYLLASSPYAGEYRPVIEETIDHIELVAGRLTTSPGPWDEWWGHVSDENGDDWTHRTYMMAAALGMAATLTDDPAAAEHWRDLAEMTARRGMDDQWTEDDGEAGVNPERGGYDVQYQMYGIWLAELYLATLPEGDLRDDLVATIERAIRWDVGRIDPQTGLIDIRGSTRVCAEKKWFSGQPRHGSIQPRRSAPCCSGAAPKGMPRWSIWPSSWTKVRSASATNAPGRSRRQARRAREVAAEEGGDRGFDTPIGALSVRRVAVAAFAGMLAGLLALLALRRMPSIGTGARRGAAIGAAILVFVCGLWLLAA